MTGFEAIIVAGGASRRLGGGLAKPDVEIAGTSLLQRAVATVTDASVVRVVGPEVDGGPVAAIADALADVRSRVVVVLACDMPLLTRDTVARLTAALTGRTQAALLVDDAGRRQYLAAAYDVVVLRRRIDELGDPRGGSMRGLVAGLRVHEVAAQAGEALDCDTWDDVRRATELLEEL